MSNDVDKLDPESRAADKAAHRGEPAQDVLRGYTKYLTASWVP